MCVSPRTDVEEKVLGVRNNGDPILAKSNNLISYSLDCHQAYGLVSHGIVGLLIPLTRKAMDHLMSLGLLWKVWLCLMIDKIEKIIKSEALLLLKLSYCFVIFVDYVFCLMNSIILEQLIYEYLKSCFFVKRLI